MKAAAIVCGSLGAIAALTSQLAAQSPNFNLTYHVERFPNAQVDLVECGAVVEKTAKSAGFSVNTRQFPNQLVMVSGGEEGKGVFTAQCIAVNDVTVTVLQGIDYRATKGELGALADQLQRAILTISE
jgi:hypothetical protein